MLMETILLSLTIRIPELHRCALYLYLHISIDRESRLRTHSCLIIGHAIRVPRLLSLVERIREPYMSQIQRLFCIFTQLTTALDEQDLIISCKMTK